MAGYCSVPLEIGLNALGLQEQIGLEQSDGFWQDRDVMSIASPSEAFTPVPLLHLVATYFPLHVEKKNLSDGLLGASLLI